MDTVQHKFHKSWTTVAACRPYRDVLTSVLSVTLPLDLSGNTKIGPPVVLRTIMGEFLSIFTHTHNILDFFWELFFDWGVAIQCPEGPKLVINWAYAVFLYSFTTLWSWRVHFFFKFTDLKSLKIITLNIKLNARGR